MFRVVKFSRYVIVHTICHVSLKVRIKRGKKDNIESLGRLCLEVNCKDLVLDRKGGIVKVAFLGSNKS